MTPNRWSTRDMMRVIAVASGKHEALLRHLGVDQFIDDTKTAPEDIVRDVDLVIDAVGKPSFRLGARDDERGDITVEVSTAASHRLNTLRGDDPDFHTALADSQANGQLKVDGDFSRLGSWFGVVHDRIVARTG